MQSLFSAQSELGLQLCSREWLRMVQVEQPRGQGEQHRHVYVHSNQSRFQKVQFLPVRFRRCGCHQPNKSWSARTKSFVFWYTVPEWNLEAHSLSLVSFVLADQCDHSQWREKKIACKHLQKHDLNITIAISGSISSWVQHSIMACGPRDDRCEETCKDSTRKYVKDRKCKRLLSSKSGGPNEKERSTPIWCTSDGSFRGKHSLKIAVIQ